MKHLVGRDFAVAEGRYRIVDVRHVGVDAMVYAEPLGGDAGPGTARGAVAAPVRAAFHYNDIARLLDTPPAAI